MDVPPTDQDVLAAQHHVRELQLGPVPPAPGPDDVAGRPVVLRRRTDLGDLVGQPLSMTRPGPPEGEPVLERLDGLAPAGRCLTLRRQQHRQLGLRQRHHVKITMAPSHLRSDLVRQLRDGLRRLTGTLLDTGRRRGGRSHPLR
jgi:hypothetical protein